MAASIMALTFFESRLFPRSERSLRRKTEIRSERSYASIHRYMVAGCLPNALATFCTFSKVRLARSIFEQRLEDLESCHGSLPSLCRYGDQIRRPRLLAATGPIWFGVPYRNALKFTFAQLPGNNGVDVGVVHNDESRSAPADRTSWQELQHSCHGRFFAPDGGKTLPS